MCNRYNQLDVTTTFTTNFLFSHFHTASVADNTFITDTFVLTAMALIVLNRSEDTFAEQTVTFRLISTVVDGLRFQHFTVRVLQNFFRRCQSDCNLREITLYLSIFSKSHTLYLYLLIEC